MREYIENRVITIGTYIVEHGATVRQAAMEHSVSKSTVHKDVSFRLVQINPELAKEVRKVLEINKAERHIRGGLATREKYMQKKEKNNEESLH